MAPNPNPAGIHDSMWWLWERLHALESESRLGGIYADKPGYHNTRAAHLEDRPGDYSIRHAEDRQGPANLAAAIDWTFPSAQRGDYAVIAKYHARFMTAARSRDPRLTGWREGFGQADSDREVEGWDIRDHEPSSSDASHLWHIHASEVRRYIASWDNKAAMLSVLTGESLADYIARGGKLIDPRTGQFVGGDDMPGYGYETLQESRDAAHVLRRGVAVDGQRLHLGAGISLLIGEERAERATLIRMLREREGDAEQILAGFRADLAANRVEIREGVREDVTAVLIDQAPAFADRLAERLGTVQAAEVGEALGEWLADALTRDREADEPVDVAPAG